MKRGLTLLMVLSALLPSKSAIAQAESACNVDQIIERIGAVWSLKLIV